MNDAHDLAIVECVIALAKLFKLGWFAEGVETVQHSTVLLQLSDELAKGYGIVRLMWGVIFQLELMISNLMYVGRQHKIEGYNQSLVY